MKKFIFGAVTLACISASAALLASPYSTTLCQENGYECYHAERGETWESLFPNQHERDLVKRLNRVNLQLRPGMVYAVPSNLGSVNKLDLAPFPHHITSTGEKTVIVDQAKLAWGAYSADGELVNWGPASGGKGYCPDLGRGCRTATGTFHVYNKGSAGCVSHKFPVGRGGAEMPYCMFFKGGFALHGSKTVPGFNASHGCIRLFTEDARWLNQDFIDTNSTKIVVEKPGAI